jgi:cell division septal protein FtsQ
MLLCSLLVLIVLMIFAGYAVSELLVTTIEVVGESRYSEDVIMETSGIEPGQRLLLLPRTGIKKTLLQALPYLEAIKVSLIPPGTARITVTAATPLCVLQLPEGPFVISDKWCILGPAEAADAVLPVVNMDMPEGQQAGGELAFLSEADRRMAVDIFTALQDNDILKDISAIDMKNTAEISVRYLDRFTVRLGDKLDLAAKLRLVEASALSLSQTARGTLDATLDGRVSYRPERKGNGN